MSRKPNSKPGRKPGTRSDKPAGGYRPFDKSQQISATKRMEDGKEVREVTQGDINDLDDYTSSDSPLLENELLTFSFTSFMGMPTSMGTCDGNSVSIAVPNLMQISVNPSVSYTSRTSPMADGVNVEGLRTFTMLNFKSGRKAEYQQQDVTLSILAIGDILAEFGMGARALGSVGLFNQRNRAYPDQSMRMIGFNMQDIKSNLSNYRAGYNYLVAKFNQIPIFAHIKYFGKCLRMFSSIYVDELGSDMAQTYALVPDSQWILDEKYDTNGSGLRTVHNPAWLPQVSGFSYWNSFQDYLNNLKAMIDALLNSETLNYIYADITRLAVKEGYALFKLSELPDSFAITPTKSDEMSQYLNNAIILPAPSSPLITTTNTFTVDNDVTGSVNKNAIIYNPQFILRRDIGGFLPLLNFKNQNPSIDDKMYSTRFFHLADACETVTISGQSRYIPVSVTLTDWYITKIVVTDGNSATGAQLTNSFQVATADLTLMSHFLSKFDWHPTIYQIDTSAVVSIGDLQWFTTLPFDRVKAIDDVAMMNLIKLRS